MQKNNANSKVEPVLVVHSYFFGTKAPILRKHPHVFWFLVGLACLGTSIYLFLYTRAVVFISAAVPLSIGIILVPFGIWLGAIVLDAWGVDVGNFVSNPPGDPPVDIPSWFPNEVAVFSGNGSMIGRGLFSGVIATVVFGLGGAFSNLETVPRFGLASIILTAGFFAWVGVFNVFCVSRIIRRLGKFDLRVEMDPFGVMTTGKTLAKCYYIAAVIWCVFTSRATVGMRAGYRSGRVERRSIVTASAFEIAKHYEVFSADGEKSFKIREIEVVVIDGKVFRWSGNTRQLFPLACAHLKTVIEAYDDWRERVSQVLDRYKAAVVSLEAKFSIPMDQFEVVSDLSVRLPTDRKSEGKT